MQRLKTQCPEEEDLWRHQLLYAESGRDPLPSPRPGAGWASPGHSGTGRSRDLLGEPPKPCADLQGRSALGTGQGAWQGLVPWARPSEEGGRGPGLRSPAPTVSGSESHARTGASTVVFLNPGVGMQWPGPAGPAWVGFEPARL